MRRVNSTVALDSRTSAKLESSGKKSSSIESCAGAQATTGIHRCVALRSDHSDKSCSCLYPVIVDRESRGLNGTGVMWAAVSRTCRPTSVGLRALPRPTAPRIASSAAQRAAFSTSNLLRHKHIDKPKAGEEYGALADLRRVVLTLASP